MADNILNKGSVGGGSSNLMGKIGGGAAALGSLYSMYGDINNIAKQDPSSAFQDQAYNPYAPPPAYQAQDNPFQKGTGGQMAFSNAAKGAMAGTAIAPGIGTAIGAGVGALSGVIGGAFNSKKRKEFEAEQEAARMQNINAHNVYNENMGVVAMDDARQKQLALRGMGNMPSYGSTIYGI